MPGVVESVQSDSMQTCRQQVRHHRNNRNFWTKGVNDHSLRMYQFRICTCSHFLNKFNMACSAIPIHAYKEELYLSSKLSKIPGLCLLLMIWTCGESSILAPSLGKTFSAEERSRLSSEPKCTGTKIKVHIESAQCTGAIVTGSEDAPISFSLPLLLKADLKNDISFNLLVSLFPLFSSSVSSPISVQFHSAQNFLREQFVDVWVHWSVQRLMN